jgi:hypothetical protein
VQAEFATTPKNILGGLCPLNIDEIAQLYREKPGAHFLTQIGCGRGISQNPFRATTISTRQTLQKSGRQSRISRDKLAKESIEIAAIQIATG